jgi:hypothetical protein
MNSASNVWEADPWHASGAVAEAQLAGFRARAAKPIEWEPIRSAGPTVFGVSVREWIGRDVEYYTTHDGEDLLLMRLGWHGFPDPPEWRLATRPSGNLEGPWAMWGYFADLPQAWIVPAGD